MPHLEIILQLIKDPYGTRKFPKPAATSLQEKNPNQIGSPQNSWTSYLVHNKIRIKFGQKEVNNKIRTASVDQYCGAFSNSDWPEMLTQGRKICLESPCNIWAQSNGSIENYNCCRKPGLLRILRQNPNLTLLGLYHKAELYHNIMTIMFVS